MIAQLIRAAHEYETSAGLKLRRKVGICGQAPSDYPDFLQFLVREGIDSISLNFDTFAKGRVNCHRTEVIERLVPEDLRQACYDLLNSFDRIIDQLRIPRGRMRFIKTKLAAQNRKDEKLWDVVQTFEEIYESLHRQRSEFVLRIEAGESFGAIRHEYERVVKDKARYDAALSYSS
ncbi:MAG: hypothetical protein Kow0069_25830 [Promethearchaeota archaeon]